MVESENAGDTGDEGSIPGSGGSPGEGNGNSLQYFFLGKHHGPKSLVVQLTESQRVEHNLATEHTYT